jgi:hypothetical protein
MIGLLMLAGVVVGGVPTWIVLAVSCFTLRGKRRK